MVVATLLAIRIYDTQRGPALEPWHRYIPKEMSARELDKADWDQYIQAEKAIFEEIR